MAVDSSSSSSAAPPPLSQTNHLLVGSYLTICGLWGVSQLVYIPYVAHLLLLVTAILYAACHASLVLLDAPPPEAAAAGESQHSKASMSSDRETLKTEDAYSFPIIGSITLFSLYLAFKFLDPEWVNLLIGAYFAIVGCLALTMSLAPALQMFMMSPPPPPEDDKKKDASSPAIAWDYKVAHPLPEWLAGESPWDLSVEASREELVALLISAVVCGFYVYYKPWFLNNVIGICFCLQGIERFSLGTYKIGAILLIGLFFYDIFWVFGTEVMVTVAKNLDGPIKILFPRDSLEVNPETGKLDLSLLGLGDIVIPGFFLALLLRFDAHRAQQNPSKGNVVHASFPKPYFHSALAAYVAGLGTTMFVMIQFNAAQPALLYLVPACLGSSFACAIARGEVKELLEYSEEEDEEEEEDGDGGEKEAEKRSQAKKEE